MKVLLQFADESYLVSPETAAKVQRSLPANRFVTVTPIEEKPEPGIQPGGNQKSTLFDRHQAKLTDKELPSCLNCSRESAPSAN
jgi:hypothetical protein